MDMHTTAPASVTAAAPATDAPPSPIDFTAAAAAKVRELVREEGNEALAHLEAKLGIKMGETTPDGLFTLQQSECLGACADSPVMLVNDRHMCSFMSNQKLDQLIAGLKAAGANQ